MKTLFQEMKNWKATCIMCGHPCYVSICSCTVTCILNVVQRNLVLALAARAAEDKRFGCTYSDKDGGLPRPTDRMARLVASPKISPRFAAGFLNDFWSSRKCTPANCIPVTEHSSSSLKKLCSLITWLLINCKCMSVPWFSPDSFMVNKNNKHEFILQYREWNLQLRVNQLRNSLLSWRVKFHQNIHKGHPLDPILSLNRSAIHVYVSVMSQEAKLNGYWYMRPFQSKGNGIFHIIPSSNHRFHNVTSTCTTSVSTHSAGRAPYTCLIAIQLVPRWQTYCNHVNILKYTVWLNLCRCRVLQQ